MGPDGIFEQTTRRGDLWRRVVKRRVHVVLSLTLINIGSPAPGALSSPPDVVKAYVSNDVLAPGDYAWMKGAFTDASEKDKAEFGALSKWAAQCIVGSR